MKPATAEEEALLAQGYRLIAGMDEAGRGALAGPVVAAAVLLPLPFSAPWLEEVRDSKELRPGQREALEGHIWREALAVGVGVVEVDHINGRGILPATREAMRRAVAGLPLLPQFLLVDWIKLPGFSYPYKPIVKGDKRCLSIACASIVAKVARDRLMREADQLYPGYGFARHKGYGTRSHLAALAELGCCPLHRRSFAPVKARLL